MLNGVEDAARRVLTRPDSEGMRRSQWHQRVRTLRVPETTEPIDEVVRTLVTAGTEHRGLSRG